MNNTYLKPSVEILQVETGAFLDELRISIPKDVENDGAGGAKSRNPQGTDNTPANPNAPQDDALAFPSSIWDD